MKAGERQNMHVFGDGDGSEPLYESIGPGPVITERNPIPVGRCQNEVARGIICGQTIFSDSDYDTIGPDKFICEKCVDKLLSPHIESQADSMGRMNNKNKVKGNTENHGKVFRNYKIRWEKK